MDNILKGMPCKVYFNKDREEYESSGVFLEFGIDYCIVNEIPINYSIGIVMLNNGEICSAPVNSIKIFDIGGSEFESG